MSDPLGFVIFYSRLAEQQARNRYGKRQSFAWFPDLYG